MTHGYRQRRFGGAPDVIGRSLSVDGIRIALGAQTGDVRRLVLRHGLLLTCAGIALGLAVALALARVMSALLFGVSPTDLVTYVAVAAGLATVALLATYLPAHRASRVDPIVALRTTV